MFDSILQNWQSKGCTVIKRKQMIKSSLLRATYYQRLYYPHPTLCKFSYANPQSGQQTTEKRPKMHPSHCG